MGQVTTSCPLCAVGDHDAEAGVPHDRSCPARTIPMPAPAVVRLRPRPTRLELAAAALGGRP